MNTRKTPDRAQSGAQIRASAVLVSLDFGTRDATARSEEAVRLVKTLGADVAEVVTGKRARPDAATFAGSGKVEQIRDALRLHNAQTVVFDQALSAAQVRNLEKALAEGWKPVRVYDRTELILEIFAQRARSHEGKLQVELAQLQHHASRLVRGWSHLERQRGSLGKTGGPGEKQIELDRRMIGERVKKLKERIQKVTRTRETQRSGRNRSGLLRVSLVGYTNAGKSTLFNALTKARSYAADQLFATLDTTTRQLWLPEAGCAATLSDTVGFIRDLPHKLVEAFQATLREVADADLLLHVVDGASPTLDEQVAEVGRVLEEIGAGAVPQLLVYNKCDRLENSRQPREAEDWVELPAGVRSRRVFVSALKGTGLDVLRKALAAEVLARDRYRAPAMQPSESSPGMAQSADLADLAELAELAELVDTTDMAETPETAEVHLPQHHA